MGAIDILLTVCLLASPDSCEQKTVPIGDVGNLRECMAWAPPTIAAWSTEHPKYRIVRWRCIYPDAAGEPI